MGENNSQGKAGDNIMTSGENNNNSQEVGTLNNPSATGANPELPCFSKNNLDKHFGSGKKSDHSSQYPFFTKEQYAQRALELARSPVGDGIEGYIATCGNFAGSIVRYDTSTNDWVRAWSGSGIASMFKPSDNVAYFKRINKIEGSN